jgi:hypothetical protein
VKLILQAYYNARDTPIDAVSLFDWKYPTTKRGRRPGAGKQDSNVPTPVYESPVHEPDFCWKLDRAALKTAMTLGSQEAFAVGAANNALPKTKKCGGPCGLSYPRGQHLSGTVNRITSLWEKNEWKKTDGIGLCALCKSDDLMEEWRVFTKQDNLD